MGKQQEIETLINEEALLLAMYLRFEKQRRIPRVVNLASSDAHSRPKTFLFLKQP
jgi:hypothetical protein